MDSVARDRSVSGPETSSESIKSRRSLTAAGAVSASLPHKWEWAWRGAARVASACVQYRAATWFRPPRAPAKTRRGRRKH